MRATWGVWSSEWHVCEEAKEKERGRWGQRWGTPRDSSCTTPVNQLPWVLSFYPEPWGETVIGKQLQGWDLEPGPWGRRQQLGVRGIARLAWQTLVGKPGNSVRVSSSRSCLGHQGSLTRLTQRPKWKRGKSELLLGLAPPISFPLRSPHSLILSQNPNTVSLQQDCFSPCLWGSFAKT